MSKKNLTYAGGYPIPKNEEELRAMSNNVKFMAEHQQNLRDGFMMIGTVSASASEEEQEAFCENAVKRIRQLETNHE